MAEHGGIFAYVGNWDRHKSPAGTGIGICRYDAEGGGLVALKSVFPGITVGAACLDFTRSIFYCVDEYTTLPGYYVGGGGRVFAFSVDSETGDLAELNHQPSYGSLPSYVAVDASRKYLIVTHHTDRVPVTKIVKDEAGPYRIALEYDDATTVLFPLRADGSIGEPCDVFTHSGNGGPLARQTHPQLHSVTMSPSGRLFVVCDKGNDAILSFRINRGTDKLEPCGEVKTLPGSSPRYSAFHPSRPFLFVNHETRAVVSSFHYAEDGRLRLIGTVSALPDDCADAPNIKQSDIRVHPSGKHLYSLIRGIDVVTVFAIDDATGSIQKIQTVALDGAGPRGCAFSPDGRYLLIAALTSKEVLTWAIRADGMLQPTGKTLRQPNPGTVTFR